MGNRPKMSVAERAKQFMPFAALKGFEEALEAVERQKAPRIELTQERKEELDYILRGIEKNDIVEVVYYSNEEYYRRRGMVSCLDYDARIIGIVSLKVLFEDIYDLEIVSKNSAM